MSTLCTPASTEHLFRVKVCLRVSLSQQQQGQKMGLPRLLLMCGNSHGGTHSHLSHKIALVKLYEDKMNWPRFPKLFFLLLNCLLQSLHKRKAKNIPLLRFLLIHPSSLLRLFYDWITQVTKKVCWTEERQVTVTLIIKFKESYDVHALLLVECSLFSLLKQFTHAFYLSCL